MILQELGHTWRHNGDAIQLRYLPCQGTITQFSPKGGGGGGGGGVGDVINARDTPKCPLPVRESTIKLPVIQVAWLICYRSSSVISNCICL